MSGSFDELVAELAASQHGVFTRAQVLGLAQQAGRPDGRGLARVRVENGRWKEPHPGVFQIAGLPDRWISRLAAAVLARPDSAVSHESAGVLHRMRYVRRDVISIIGTRSAKPLVGVEVHRPRRVSRRHFVTVEGLLVTDRASTIIDLAAVLGAGRFERVLDDQLASHRVEIPELVAAFERQARRGKNGIAIARRLLEDRLGGRAASGSELEHLFRELVEPHLPLTPDYQFLPRWRTEGVGRADAAFPTRQVIAELDGRRWHLRDADFETDRRRDQDALERDWRTVRYTYDQVRNDPERVARNLTRILELGP